MGVNGIEAFHAPPLSLSRPSCWPLSSCTPRNASNWSLTRSMRYLVPLSPPVAARAPVVEEIVREISARNIEATVRKLAGFHTRHTLSDAASDERGIGAARRWIKGELERYGREGGGRLQVTLDEFTARMQAYVVQELVPPLLQPPMTVAPVTRLWLLSSIATATDAVHVFF